MKAHLYRGGTESVCRLPLRGFRAERILVTTPVELLEHRLRCKKCVEIVMQEIKQR